MIYISLSASSKENIMDAILELVQLGFVNIELGGGKLYCEGTEEKLLDLKEKHKINFLVHSYFPPPAESFMMNIASDDEKIRNNTFKLITTASQLTKKLGNDLYTIHPGKKRTVYMKNGGFYIKPEFENGRENKPNSREDFFNSLDSLLELAQKNKVKIAVENDFPLQGRFHSWLESGEDIIGFLDRYRETPTIGLLLDLGHLAIAAHYLKFDRSEIISKLFAEYPHKIFEVHVSENDGKNDLHLVSPSNSWQIKLLYQKSYLLNGAPIVFEWQNSSNSQTRKSFLRIEKLLKEAIAQ